MPFVYEYPRPCVTVDAVVFRRAGGSWEALLIRRKFPPYQGSWVFPGGFMEMDETLEEAVVRELQEETGLTDVPLEQLAAFSAIDRDPRHRTVGIAFWGIAPAGHDQAAGGDDAEEARWFPIDDMPPLAFDHGDILRKALEKIR